MKFQIIIAAAAIPVAIVAAEGMAEAQAPAIVWDTDNALALGTGCSSRAGDAAFISSGNSVAVLFSKLGVDLPAGGTSNALTGLKSCSVRIPATLRKGFYFSELIQTITYGVNKSYDSSGTITSLASFFNKPVASFTVNVPRGVKSSPAIPTSKTNAFLVNASCFSGYDLKGLYRGDLSVAGTRASKNESIILTTEGLDLRYEITCPIRLCAEP